MNKMKRGSLHLVHVVYPTLCLLSPVSLDDISALRLGRQSEGLRKYTEEQVESRCFSIIFKGRRKNLDLIASSEDEARQWVSGLEKMISKLNNLSSQQKTEQYPLCVAAQVTPVDTPVNLYMINALHQKTFQLDPELPEESRQE